MKLVKSSAIILAMSAMLAGPVLAQSASPGAAPRAGKTNMQSAAPGSGDEEMTAQPGAKKAAHAKAGSKNTVGMSKSAPGDAGDDSSGKR